MEQKLKEAIVLVAMFSTDEQEVLKKDLKKAGTVESMHFHDDWTWIMPVVVKLDQIGWMITMQKEGLAIYDPEGICRGRIPREPSMEYTYFRACYKAIQTMEDDKKRVLVIMTNDDKGLWSIYEESGQALEHDFTSDSEAKQFAKDQNWKVVNNFLKY